METGKSRPNVDFGSDSKGGVSVSLLDKSWYNDVTVSGTLTDEEVYYFKDILGGSLPTPGSPLDKALGPSIPPPDSDYQFGAALEERISKMPGWNYLGWTKSLTLATYDFHFRCPHGPSLDYSISEQLLATAPWDGAVVDALIQGVYKRCAVEHGISHHIYPKVVGGDSAIVAAQNAWNQNHPAVTMESVMKQLHYVADQFVTEPLDAEKVKKEFQEQIAKAYGIPLAAILPQSLKKPGVYEFQSIDQGTMGLAPERTPLDELAELVPALKSQHVRHPDPRAGCDPFDFAPCGEQGGALKTIGYMIVHLNDRHQWPREKIATWLESLHNVDLTFQSAQKGD